MNVNAWRIRPILACAGVLAIASLVGCGIFDEDDEKGTIDPPLTVATTPDELVELLTRAYVERDYELYATQIHEEFEFEFAPEEHFLAGTADGIWGRSRDGQSTKAMLNGEPNKDGRVLQNIELELTPEEDPWSMVTEGDLAGTQRRSYTMAMDVEVSGNLTYQVRGDQEFFVVQVDDRWQLRFWRDLGVSFIKASSESKSVGAVKSLY